MADLTGAADLVTVLPSAVAFRGFVLFDQVIVQNLPANPFGIQVSNFGRSITGERTY